MPDSTLALDRVLSAFAACTRGAEPLTAPELADELGCARRTAYEKLQALTERGDLATKKVGARGRVWWRPGATEPDDGTVAWDPDAVLDRVTDGFCAVDEDWRVTYVNAAAERLIGRDAPEIVGRPLWEVFPDSVGKDGHRHVSEAMEAQEPVSYERYHDGRGVWFEVRVFPSETGLSIYFRDVTERRRRERERERYETVVETVDDGVYVLDADQRIQMVNDALASMTGYDRAELLGSHASLISPPSMLRTSEAQRTELRAGERERGRIESEFETADGESVPVETRFRPLPAGDEFRGTVGVVRDVGDRRERERRIVGQRDELARLHRITELVYDVIGGTIESETRATVEQLVCDRLVESTFYRFALVGRPRDRDRGYEDVTVAGIDADKVEMLESGDYGTDGTTAAAAAYAENEVRVVSRVAEATDLPAETRQHAAEWGVESVVAVPISYRGTTYAVLVVGSGRPAAFGEREQTVLELLGQVLGHAFNALETKQSLYADRTTELTLASESPVGFFSEVSGDLGCRFVHRSMVPTADGSVQYVTLSGADPEAVHARARDSAHVAASRTVRSDGDEHLLELQTDTSGVAPLIDAGCRIVRSVAEEGRPEIVARISADADVQGVVDRVTTQLPGLAVVAKRTDVRPSGPPASTADAFAVADALTDKQVAALRAAYAAGYYNWPRDSTAEEVADALGVDPSTLHQHLRKAQSHLIGTALDAVER